MFKVQLVHRPSSSSSLPSSVLIIAPNVHPCHLLPIFTARGTCSIFTDEWSQQRCQYFQWLSKTNSKTCWRFNWPNRSKEAVRSGELDCIWNYGILLRYLQSLTFPFKFEKQPFGRKGLRMSSTACLEKCSKKQKLPTLVPDVLSVGEPKGLFWWCHMNIWRWEESCHNSLTLPLPTLVTFILAGWQAFAQRKRRKAWIACGPISFGTIARNPEYIY